MIALTLRGLAQRKLRAALTALAVLLGVAMIAGTFIQTDRINSAFEEIERTAQEGSDLVITPKKGFSTQFQTIEPFDGALVERLAALEGVRKAGGQLQEFGQLVVDGKPVESSFAPTFVFSLAEEPFDATRISEGRKPEAPGEVMVNEKLFEDENLEIGQDVAVATRTGTQAVKLVGTFRFGRVSSIGGATLIVSTLEAVQRWYDAEGRVTTISIAAEDGADVAAVAAAARRIVPKDLQVRTGEQEAEANAKEINDQIGGFLTPALLAFAGAAVLVGAFIIFNTFSITVAQRTREFALLRTLGASRRQVVSAVLIEALVIGVLASLLGLFAGIGFAIALAALFDLAGFGIPSAALEVAPRTIVVALAVGVLVTLTSALAPAFRATRVPPMVALAGTLPPPSARGHKIAMGLSALVSLLGLVILVAGLFGSGPAEQRLATIAGGAILLLVGVAAGARNVVRPLARIAGWPVERLFKLPGRLARENAMRNPGRTATTSAALMVGLALVVFVSVFAAGLKASVDEAVADLVKADLIVTGKNFTPLPEKAGAAMASVEGVRGTSGILLDEVEVNGEKKKSSTDVVNGADLEAFDSVYAFEWKQGGGDDTVGALRPGEAVVEEQFAKAHRIAVGEQFDVETASGGKGRFRMVAMYEDPQLVGGFLVSVDDFRRISPARDPFIYLVAFEESAGAATTRVMVEAALRRFPAAEARSNAEYREEISRQLDQLVFMLYALLMMSVVISLFGIANSLFLSIHERTREIGLLRAIGTTGRQVRRIIRYESVIVAVIGGILGILMGLLFAFLITTSLSDFGLGFEVPWAQLVVFLLLSGVVGVIGAALPARRGARIDVLEALRHD